MVRSRGLRVVVLASCGLHGLIAQPAGAQFSISGVVREKSQDVYRPLTHAFVSLTLSSGAIVATVRTDGDGRYRFVDVPHGRFSLVASKSGYLPARAAGAVASRATIDCSNGCLESALDFDLSPAAMVSGVILDELHEPLARAIVTLRRKDVSASLEKPVTGVADDRGRFHISGLKPGSYIVAVLPSSRRGQKEVLTRTLEVSEGQRITGLNLTLGERAQVSVAGTLSGVPFGEGDRTWVEIRPLSGSARALQVKVGPDGRFEFPSVSPGRYLAAAFVIAKGTGERADYSLNVFEVLGESSQIVLHPIEPASVTGAVETASGNLPSELVIRFTSKDGFGYRWSKVSTSRRVLEFQGLRPGTYRIETDSPKFYVKGVRIGDSFQPGSETSLGPGMNRLSLVIAADQGQVLGVVRTPAQEPLPNASVALRGDREQYLVQADGAGRFLFGQVAPGEYRICAWSRIEASDANDPSIWERAGCQNRIVPVNPSGMLEINLQAGK